MDQEVTTTKCHFCGKEIPIKGSICHKGQYYCDKAEYDLSQKCRETTKDLICEILNEDRKKIYSGNWVDVDVFEDQYTVKFVCSYLQSDKAPLRRYLSRLNGQNVTSRFKYLMAAMRNNLQSYKMTEDQPNADKVYRPETCQDVVVPRKTRRRCLEDIENSTDDVTGGNDEI